MGLPLRYFARLRHDQARCCPARLRHDVPRGRPEMTEGGERQVPFYCPYCGDTDLRPDAPEAGSWRCASCARAFKLTFTGVVPASQASS